MNDWDKIHAEKYSVATWINKNNPLAEEVVPYLSLSNISVLDIGGGQGQDSEFFLQVGIQRYITGRISYCD